MATKRGAHRGTRTPIAKLINAEARAHGSSHRGRARARTTLRAARVALSVEVDNALAVLMAQHNNLDPQPLAEVA